MMVELRTGILGLNAAMLLLSCAGVTLGKRERGPATIESVNASLDATRSNDQCTPPAARNLRHRISQDEVLLFPFPLSMELNQAVTTPADRFITLQSAGNLTKMAEKAIPVFRSLFATPYTASRELHVGSTGSFATSERTEVWRRARLRNRTSDSVVLSRCEV